VTIQVEKSMASWPKILPHAPRQQEDDDDRGPAARDGGTIRYAREAEQRHEADQAQRDAEHERRRGAGGGARDGEPPGEHETGEREDEPPASPRPRWLRQISNRGRDRHHADTPGGDGDDHERQDDTEPEGDDQAPHGHGELDLEALVRVGCPERGRHHEHHPERDERPEEDADDGRREVVREALEREHLDQVPAPGPDRARDPELAPPLGREHHEDEEDEEDAGGDRERAERREERHERRAGLLGVVDRLLLDGLHLEAQRRHDGRDEVGDLAREACSRGRVATVRDEDDLDLALPPEQALRLAERREERRVGGSGAVEANGVAHARTSRLTTRVDGHDVSGRDAELVGRLAVEVDLARPQVAERDGAPIAPANRRKALHPRGVGREEHHARLALALRGREDRHLLDDRSGDSVHEPRRLEHPGDPRDGHLVEPSGSGRGAERARDVGDGSLGCDRLVGVPERPHRRRADRVAHGVPGRERRSDDHRPERQPDHDEGASARAASDAPNGELEQDPVADREHR
jgi:hypothetical protein